jgi:ABC-type nitrate/sulfonate/bicarbonate transport system permease component
MSGQVVLQLTESGARRAPQPNRAVRVTWRHFARTTWVHLAVALAIFVLGIGIATHLFIVVGRWQGPQHVTQA